jgi:putative hydrolase of the HAD superfamily
MGVHGGAAHGIELVCFDIGRVLLRICDDWQHACRLAGIAVPPAVSKGPPPPAVDDLIRRYDTGAIDLDTFAREMAPLSRMAPRDIVRLQEHYLLGAYPGVADLLDELVTTGVRTACLSNTADPHWQMMQDRSGPHYLPLERLNYRFASHLVGFRKPDDAIYAHVERETGLSGNRIVFFDDVEENVQAAARRGWRACRVDPTPDDPLPQVRRFLRHQRLL